MNHRDKLAEELLDEPLLCSAQYPREVKAAFKLGYDAGERSPRVMALVRAIRDNLTGLTDFRVAVNGLMMPGVINYTGQS